MQTGHRWITAIAAGAIWIGCNGKLLTITVEDASTAEIPGSGLGPLDDLVGALGFDGFQDMDFMDQSELANQGVEAGDVSDVYLTELTLRVLDPADGDLSFLSSLEFFVEAPGLDPVRIAHRSSFPEGTREVSMEVVPVDLTDYVVSERMTLTTQAEGELPSSDTLVEGAFAMDVGVTRQGACNNL